MVLFTYRRGGRRGGTQATVSPWDIGSSPVVGLTGSSLRMADPACKRRYSGVPCALPNPPPKEDQIRTVLLLVQSKNHCNGGRNLDRDTVQERRLVLPLVDGIHG